MSSLSSEKANGPAACSFPRVPVSSSFPSLLPASVQVQFFTPFGLQGGGTVGAPPQTRSLLSIFSGHRPTSGKNHDSPRSLSWDDQVRLGAGQWGTSRGEGPRRGTTWLRVHLGRRGLGCCLATAQPGNLRRARPQLHCLSAKQLNLFIRQSMI